MTSHTPMPQVSRLEVIATGARRRWTLEEKQRIVAESYGGPRLVSVTARRNWLSASQLFTWRRNVGSAHAIRKGTRIWFIAKLENAGPLRPDNTPVQRHSSASLRGYL